MLRRIFLLKETIDKSSTWHLLLWMSYPDLWVDKPMYFGPKLFEWFRIGIFRIFQVTYRTIDLKLDSKIFKDQTYNFPKVLELHFKVFLVLEFVKFYLLSFLFHLRFFWSLIDLPNIKKNPKVWHYWNLSFLA